LINHVKSQAIFGICGSRPVPDGNYQIELNKAGAGWQLKLRPPSERNVLLVTPFAQEIHVIAVNGGNFDAEKGQGNAIPLFRWLAASPSEMIIT